MDRNEIVKLALDAHSGNVAGNYSKGESMEVLRNALLDANGGKTKMDIRDVRDGKCAELFAIIEEIIDAVKHDMVTADPFFSQFVQYKNIAMGDSLDIKTPDNSLFVVSEIGGGSQAIRRQRMFGGDKITVSTTWKAIRVYEEIELLLAGRIDFNALIDRVARSFRARMLIDIYNVWTGTITGLASPYLVSGSFTENAMLEMIEHVKAANGSDTAYIAGSMIALSKVVAGHDSSQLALNDEYASGIVGRFNGTPKIRMMQTHVPNTNTFALNNNVVHVLPGDIKPIIYVTEGQSLVMPRSFVHNVDMTEEYMMMEKTGVVAYCPDGEGQFGRYTITG